MAPAPHSHRRPVTACAVMVSWRGVPRTLRLGRAAGVAILGIVPLLAIWYLGATAYFVFHDQLLASLISRQADIQYSYEDRIAVLKTQLEREASQALVDRQTLATTIHDLSDRSAQLESRAVAIEGLVKGLAPHSHGSTSDATGGDAALLSSPPLPDDVRAYDLPPNAPGSLGNVPARSLRLDGSPLVNPGSDRSDLESADVPQNHSELTLEQQGQRIAARIAWIETQQADQVARLRDPMLQEVERLQTALAATGLPASRWNAGNKAQNDIGGPFVPLPDDARSISFEQNVALLQDAMVEHARLTGIIEKVPLRRPLEGQLEVTSPFGARLDPFFGRAAMHTGVDLMQPYGGPVRATAAGIVTVAGPEGGYGNMVEIDHGGGLVTRYAHLSSVEVTVNQKVAAGAIVGLVGATGRATGPHLHYETRINGEPVDPTRFLRAGSALFHG